MINFKSSIILLAGVFALSTSKAQENAPIIKGSVNISIKKGTISCDLILSNLPSTDKYVIMLNAGMNIHYFKVLMMR